MKKPHPKKLPITEEQINLVIEIFKSSTDNSAPAIARQLGLTKGQVDRIITQHLNSKKNKKQPVL